MKVLYLGHYADHTGWGNAALENIIAMNRVGIDVVPRRLSYKNNYETIDLPQEVLELEKKDLSGVDTCIQHTLPTNYFYYAGKSKIRNICMYETETWDFTATQWHRYINMFKEGLVPNSAMINDSWLSGVNINLNVANHCIDVDKYKNFKQTSSVKGLEDKNSYNFCYVGELTKRKNVRAILQAFHSEFQNYENVNLFLKLNMSGRTADETLKFANDLNDSVTAGLKVRKKYKSPYIFCGHAEHNDLLSFMSQCHCFVSASYGEAWCIPALESMALGLDLIFTKGTGLHEFAFDDAIVVNSVNAPCMDAIDTLPDLYTSDDTWKSVDVSSLRMAMRGAFYRKDTLDREKVKARAFEFNYERTGKQIYGALNA